MRGTLLRKILSITGICILLSVAYIGTNVATSRCAQAQACNCNVCTMPGLGVGFSIAGIFTATVGPGIATATSTISAHFTAVIASYVADIMPLIGPYTLASGQWGIERNVADDLTDWLDAFWFYDMRPTFQRMTSQLTTINTDQSRALGSYNDALEQVRTARMQQKEEIEAHRAYRTSDSLCTAATQSGGYTRAANIKKAYKRAASYEKLARSANAVGSPSAAGMGADQRVRFDHYCTRYVNPNFNNGFTGCPSPTGTRPPDEDLDVSGLVFSQDTIDVTDPATKQAVDDLVENIVEPFVMNPIQNTPGDGATTQKNILEMQRHKARLQVAYDALYHVIARRVPGSNMYNQIQPLRAAAGIDPSMISANPSYHEVMQAMMVDRFRSGKYQLEMVDEPENVGRQLVVERGLHVMQLSDQLDLMDYFGLMLASQVGHEVIANQQGGSGIEEAPAR